MNNKQKTYEAPEMEFLAIRNQSIICLSDGSGTEGGRTDDEDDI